MTVAVATMSEFPDRATNLWKSRGAAMALLATALVVLALAGRSEAAGCEGTPLTIVEITLPDLTQPA